MDEYVDRCVWPRGLVEIKLLGFRWAIGQAARRAQSRNRLCTFLCVPLIQFGLIGCPQFLGIGFVELLLVVVEKDERTLCFRRATGCSMSLQLLREGWAKTYYGSQRHQRCAEHFPPRDVSASVPRHVRNCRRFVRSSPSR